MNKRLKIILAALVLALLAGGWAIYWFVVAGRLDQGIEVWAAAQRAAGVDLAYQRGPITGFPFRFRTVFSDAHATGRLGGSAFDWRGPQVEASVSPLDLHALTLEAPGRHALTLDGVPYALEAGRLSTRLDFSGAAALTQVALKLRDARLSGPQGSLAAKKAALAVTLPPQPPKTDQDPLLGFSLAAEALQLPAGVTVVTADPLQDLALTGTVKGPIPAAALQAALGLWRDAGGIVDVSEFRFAQATLSLKGKATVALDNALQPIVAADMTARGLAPTIDLLTAQQRLRPEEALKLKLFVHGAERDAPGGGKELATGLTVQGGWLSWGPFKLTQLPPITWP
jgi:hypothetical protein